LILLHISHKGSERNWWWRQWVDTPSVLRLCPPIGRNLTQNPTYKLFELSSGRPKWTLTSNNSEILIRVSGFSWAPGPAMCPPVYCRPLSAPCIGHLDPTFLSIMNETQTLLRYLFQTENELTIAVSGTGSAGMEACFVNLVEPGDEVAVCVNGVFGTRMCDIVGRLGAKLIRVDAPWGKTIDPNAVREAVKGKSPKVLAIVHAETSTGVCQPLEEIKSIAKIRAHSFWWIW
jgi:hypothetical protein